MAEVLNCKGLKCPKPVLRVAMRARAMAPGSTLEVHADCSSFQSDIKKWCDDTGKVLINCVDHGEYCIATIQF